MKKRNRESIPIDSEKVNHKTNGIESPEKDGIKKAKVSIARHLWLPVSKLNLFALFLSISISPLRGISFVETRKLRVVP